MGDFFMILGVKLYSPQTNHLGPSFLLGLGEFATSHRKEECNDDEIRSMISFGTGDLVGREKSHITEELWCNSLLLVLFW